MRQETAGLKETVLAQNADVNFKSIYGFSKEFLDETKAIWEPLYKRELSYQEAADIANNWINLEMRLRDIE